MLPIPILGAFVGGLVGGFLGDKGYKQINSIIHNKSFLNIVHYLKETII